MGYAPEDARNYVVAACWEFIIPGAAMDIPNIGAISLAKTADDVIRAKLMDCATFDELMDAFRHEMRTRAVQLADTLHPLYMEPAPYASVLMSDVSHDVSLGAKYNNYGIHGTGFTLAVDQLATVKQFVFDKGTLARERLLNALKEMMSGTTRSCWEYCAATRPSWDAMKPPIHWRTMCWTRLPTV